MAHKLLHYGPMNLHFSGLILSLCLLLVWPLHGHAKKPLDKGLIEAIQTLFQAGTSDSQRGRAFNTGFKRFKVHIHRLLDRPEDMATVFPQLEEIGPTVNQAAFDIFRRIRSEEDDLFAPYVSDREKVEKQIHRIDQELVRHLRFFKMYDHLRTSYAGNKNAFESIEQMGVHVTAENFARIGKQMSRLHMMLEKMAANHKQTGLNAVRLLFHNEKRQRIDEIVTEVIIRHIASFDTSQTSQKLFQETADYLIDKNTYTSNGETFIATPGSRFMDEVKGSDKWIYLSALVLGATVLVFPETAQQIIDSPMSTLGKILAVVPFMEMTFGKLDSDRAEYQFLLLEPLAQLRGLSNCQILLDRSL